MEGIRNALEKLRLEIEKGSARKKDADTRTKNLEGTLKKREAEIVSLRERLDLTRRLIALADRWDQSCHKLQDTEDRIELADSKVERLSTALQHVEKESDTFEAQYLDFRAKHRELEAELAEFLA